MLRYGSSNASMVVCGLVNLLAYFLLLQAQKAKSELAYRAGVVLALAIICAEIETFRTCTSVRNFHVLLVVERYKLESDLGLIDTFVATCVLPIDHCCDIPSAVAEKAEITATLDAFLTCGHGFIVHKRTTGNAALAIDVLQ